MGRVAAAMIGLFLALCVWAGSAPRADALGSAAPTCAEGPEDIGGTIYGTACDDTIVAGPGVAAVEGGAGDDVIVPAPIAATSAPCPSGCRLGVGSQTFEGGPGDDIVFGERGNDTLLGGEGNDQLFGGIGDDLLQGGPGDDRLAGGFGADSIDGEGGSDYVRGDGTIDTIVDSGPASDNDTLSYATGITPGFPDNAAYPDFSAFPGVPAEGGERGVYLNLGDGVGDDGVAPLGGGVDEVEGSDFETVIGTPFADFIVGTTDAESFYGGGGGDVILGEGGGDSIHGGAGGDRCQGSGTSDCETSGGAVVQRDPSKVAIGLMAPGATPYTQLYMTGSSAADLVAATYAAGPPASVTFTLEAGSGGAFDTAAASASGCDPPSGKQVTCPLAAPLDSLVMAGLGGDDSLRASGFPLSVAVVIAGGEGADSLTGGDGEDMLVDGPGSAADQLDALGADDALLHNGGADVLSGGDGNDLFLSNATCDGSVIEGGSGRDNASWARFGEGVEANISSGQVGRPGSGGTPSCAGGTLVGLDQVEDLEGSNSPDVLYGGAEPNQLLGHTGADVYRALGGADSILANSGDADPTIDCGGNPGDQARVDHPEFGDATPVGCESVTEGDPNDFRSETELPEEAAPGPIPPVVKPPAPAPKPRPDHVPPQTRISRHPAKNLTAQGARRRLVFRFRSSEAGSRFRCRLDTAAFRRCRSPRSYAVSSGRHMFRVAAVDRAGNADPSPAVFAFTLLPRRK